MNKIKVSIVVPVYNSNQYIDQCMDSLLNQSLDDIEIICIDDGSTDNSYNTLKWYEERYEKIRVFTQENSGAAVTRNRGIDEARGEYLLFVDVDDWIDYNTTDLLYKNSLSNDSDMVLYNSEEFNENGFKRNRIFFYLDSDIDPLNYTFNYKTQKKLVFNSFLVCWSKLYKTSFLRQKNIRFHEHHKVLEDIQFHVESMILADTISYSPGKMYHYRKDNVTSVQNLRVNSKIGYAIFKVMDELKEFLEEHELYDFFEGNYLKVCLNELKVRLETCHDDIKEETFQRVRDYYLKLDLPLEYLKKVDYPLIKFYIHVINSSNYFEFLNLNPKEGYSLKNTNKILLNQIFEKNKIISRNFSTDNIDDVQILENLSSSFDDGNVIGQDTIDKIIEMDLFNEEYYCNQFDYKLDVNPLLHYLLVGYKENKNPSEKFDGNFYRKFNSNIGENDNPLVYFVNKGVKEGLVKVTPTSWQPPEYVNLFEIDEKMESFEGLGINTQKREKKLIVSLTSFPDRMKDIHYCIFSLLNQSIKPDEVVLWLAKEQFPNGEYDIPNKVLKLKKNGLTIKFCKDIRSYKKLIPALKEYPEDIIVTSDDDLYYQKDWLEKLYDEYKKNPDCIIGHRGRKIQFDSNLKLKEYMKWDLVEKNCEPTYKLLMTGAGGILYPPHCFNEKVFDEKTFMKNYKFTDDIWFWAMAVMNKTKIKTFDNNYVFFAFVNSARELNFTDEPTLFKINRNTGNYESMTKILDEFPLLLENIRTEK